jgi:hypothetical protein
MKSITGITCALALACSAAMHAQDTKTTTTTKTSGGDVKSVSYTGCVMTGTETSSYVLSKVVPVTRTTETVGTSGSTTTTETTYTLVPGERVEIQQHVGRKVEVTGMMIPAGDVKTETKTKIDNEDAKDTTIKERTKTDNAHPQFRVTAIKDLGERCQ